MQSGTKKNKYMNKKKNLPTQDNKYKLRLERKKKRKEIKEKDIIL